MSLISFCRNHGRLNVALKRNIKSPSFRDKGLNGIAVALVRKPCITTESARELLQLHDKQRDSGDGFITRAQLRSSYLQAAMLCHPDTSKSDAVVAQDRFIRVTEAYEFLLRKINGQVVANVDLTDEEITIQQEADFRVGCEQVLGLTAEKVEESKRCPLFREWLQGRTDSAYLWQSFLMQHGGLAPMLRPVTLLAAPTNGPLVMSKSRRKRSR